MSQDPPSQIQRFRIDAVLGRGGMGEVYRAYDPQLDRAVAIKVLAASEPVRGLDDRATLDLREPAPPGSDELLAEARVMAQVSDPHVVPIYEVGLDARGVFLVMELVEGEHLRDWLASASWAPDDLVAVLVQAARGLAAAHVRGIVHRDFKPENVLVGRDGRARVADFGISALVGRRTSSMVRVGESLAGTPEYMAPELWRGQPATPRSDVYAFCVVFAEALAGDRPGDGAAARAALARTLAARKIGAPAIRAILAGLEEQPERRPVDGSALVAALTAKRSFAPRIAAGVIAASALAGIGIAIASHDPPAPSCDPDPARFAGRWDAAREAKLRAVVDPDAPDRIPVVAAALENLERRVTQDTSMRVAACRDHAAGKITEAQRAMRTACLDRRIFELGARIGYLISKPKVRPSLVLAMVQNLPELDRCAVIEGSPLATAEARAAAEALYTRLLGGADMVAPDLVAMLEPLITDAEAAGDLELAARAATRRAERLVGAAQAEADATLAAAHRYALAAKSEVAVARALIERSRHALARYELGAGRAFAELALELVDRAFVPPLTRAQIFHAVARAAQRRGDAKTTLQFIERGLAAIGPETPPTHATQIDLRLDKLRALETLEGKAAERNRLAIETLELARERYHGKGPDYRNALMLARSAAKAVGDHARAEAYDKAALDQIATQKTWTRAGEVFRQAGLAITLFDSGRFEEAYRHYTAAAEEAAGVPEMAADRPLYVVAAALALGALGRYDETHAMLQEALVDFTAQYGKAHPRTIDLMTAITGLELELGHLDKAERRLERVERVLQAKPDPTDERRAKLAGTLRAELLLQRGDAAAAEQLAVESLRTLDELGASRETKSGTERVRLSALNALERWAEARDLAKAELALARTKRDDPSAIAGLEYQLARAEYGLGERAAAIARARDAAHVLDKWRFAPRNRREVAAWLAAVDP